MAAWGLAVGILELLDGMCQLWPTLEDGGHSMPSQSPDFSSEGEEWPGDR
jgi:hypothetical protein